MGQISDKGEIEPFICASKKLTATQQRWSTTKRELYGLMWSMQKFNNYLQGRNFIARVDHKPLVNLITSKMSLVMQGWVDNLLLYDFTTEYLPGEKNELADALSRCHEILEIRNVEMETKEELSDLDRQLLWEAEKKGLEMPPKSQRESLVKEYHAMGHFGVESCCQRIQQEGFWWPHMRQDIKRKQQACVKCIRFDVVAEGFHPSKLVVADLPWDHLEIDLIGPLLTSQQGNTYILTIVDVCTAYTVLRPLYSKEMEVVARRLWEVFTDFGTPKILQSDNGLEFVNKVMKAMTTLHGIEPKLSATYNSRTNGLVERRNKDVSLALKKFMEGAYGCWDDWLPLVQMSLNQLIGKRTGSAAFDIMFNQPFNGLGDFRKVKTIDDLDKMVMQNKDAWKIFKEAVIPGLKARVAQVKREQREKMDMRKRVEPIQSGEQVWIQDVTRGGKWEPVYEGPYTVLRQNKGGTYSLLDAAGELLPRRVPVAQIRVTNPINEKKNEKTETTMAKARETAEETGESAESEQKKPVIDTKVSGGEVREKKSQLKKGNKKTSKKKVETDHFEIGEVIGHKERDGAMDYLVAWKGYGPKDNSWVPIEDFDGLATVHKYWKKLEKEKKEANKKEQEKRAREKNKGEKPSANTK